MKALKAPTRHATKTRVTKTLWPTQPGTIKLMRKYGEALLCVRYRHDASGLKRYTTIEIVVDEAPVSGKRADNRMYAVHIFYAEEHLRAQARTYGARWDQRAKKWTMKGTLVKQLGLESRAIPLPKK